MEILACPICKNPNLELIIIEEEGQEVIIGLIFCNECFRYYPIKNTIPVMLPDDLRKQDEDLKFLKTHQKSIPSDVLKKGKPSPLYKK
jgi:uncharacterized protein YbaR (Trm112 family)